MDTANCGCPTDGEFTYHNRECYQPIIDSLRAELEKEREMNAAYKRSDLVDRLSASEAQLCRARLALERLQGMEEDDGYGTEEIAEALSSTGPCRHEERITLLEKGFKEYVEDYCCVHCRQVWAERAVRADERLRNQRDCDVCRKEREGRPKANVLKEGE